MELMRGGVVRGGVVRGGASRCGKGRGGVVRGEGIETSRATTVGGIDTIRCEPVRGATSGDLSNLGVKRQLFKADAGTSMPAKTLGLRIRRSIGKSNVVAENVRYNRMGRWFEINEMQGVNDQAEGSARQANDVMKDTSLNEQAAGMDR
ncbi:hypothetical protein Tco_0968002 [Tanacetum coccineum]